jgi:hypothetical protein
MPLLDPERRLRTRPDDEPDYRPSAGFARSAALERCRATVLASLEEASVQPFDEPEGAS